MKVHLEQTQIFCCFVKGKLDWWDRLVSDFAIFRLQLCAFANAHRLSCEITSHSTLKNDDFKLQDTFYRSPLALIGAKLCRFFWVLLTW